MRVVRVHEFGPPEVLRVEELATPAPAAGQVLVAVELAGVAYGETIVRSGRYPLPLPYHPGMDVGGEAVAVGAEVDRSLLGQRVVASTVGNTGGYAELALAEAANVFPVPDGLSLEQAIPTFGAGGLAVGLLAAMRLRAGESILVTAAAGRLGSQLVQLANGVGATVIAAAGSAEKLATATGFGAQHTVNYADADWVDQVKAVTDGRGADVVLDAIGGLVGEQAFAATANAGGRIGYYGYASGSWANLESFDIARRGVWVVGPLGIVFAKPAADQHADAEQALKLAAAGNLKSHLHACYPLTEAAKAHTELESRRTTGTLLLKP